MKNLKSLLNHNRPFAASAAALLALALWVAPTSSQAQNEKEAATQPTVTEPAVVADDTKTPEQQQCQVCHQRRVTLTFACGSAGLRRHESHGDTPGPCPSTNPGADEE